MNSYVVFVPDWFNPTEEDIKNATKDAGPWIDENVNYQKSKDEINKHVRKMLERLRDGEKMWQYEGGSLHQAVYCIIYNLLKPDYVLADISSYGSESCELIGVKKDSLANAFLKSQLKTLERTFDFLKEK